MSKAKIIMKKSVHSIKNEREILENVRNSFLVNMYSAFQDRDNLYLVIDYLSGGDLRYHIGKQRLFSELQAKFICASILLGLENIHNLGIIHRDIKPENIVCDSYGYFRITDFGIGRKWKPNNSQDTSGTPGYMAPEVMCHQNHSFEVDYYALGVIAYELCQGRRPYRGKNRREIRDQILAKQVYLSRKYEDCSNWSNESIDFINRMIQRKPNQRLGFNGPGEVKQHPWFKDFPWKKLQDRM